MTLISPSKTFSNCGNSFNFVFLKMCPKGKILGSFYMVMVPVPTFELFSIIVTNLNNLK